MTRRTTLASAKRQDTMGEQEKGNVLAGFLWYNPLFKDLGIKKITVFSHKADAKANKTVTTRLVKIVLYRQDRFATKHAKQNGKTLLGACVARHRKDARASVGGYRIDVSAFVVLNANALYCKLWHSSWACWHWSWKFGGECKQVLLHAMVITRPLHPLFGHWAVVGRSQLLPISP